VESSDDPLLLDAGNTSGVKLETEPVGRQILHTSVHFKRALKVVTIS